MKNHGTVSSETKPEATFYTKAGSNQRPAGDNKTHRYGK